MGIKQGNLLDHGSTLNHLVTPARQRKHFSFYKKDIKCTHSEFRISYTHEGHQSVKKVLSVLMDYIAVRRKDLLPFETAWMDLKNIMLSEISQLEKEKYHIISLTCEI